MKTIDMIKRGGVFVPVNEVSKANNFERKRTIKKQVRPQSSNDFEHIGKILERTTVKVFEMICRNMVK